MSIPCVQCKVTIVIFTSFVISLMKLFCLDFMKMFFIRFQIGFASLVLALEFVSLFITIWGIKQCDSQSSGKCTDVHNRSHYAMHSDVLQIL